MNEFDSLLTLSDTVLYLWLQENTAGVPEGQLGLSRNWGLSPTGNKGAGTNWCRSSWILNIAPVYSKITSSKFPHNSSPLYKVPLGV